MEKKEDYISFIENNPLVKAAVKKAGKEQGELIMKIMRNAASQIADVFVPVIEKIKNDPKYAKHLQEELQKKSRSSVDIE